MIYAVLNEQPNMNFSFCEIYFLHQDVSPEAIASTDDIWLRWQLVFEWMQEPAAVASSFVPAGAVEWAPHKPTYIQSSHICRTRKRKKDRKRVIGENVCILQGLSLDDRQTAAMIAIFYIERESKWVSERASLQTIQNTQATCAACCCSSRRQPNSDARGENATRQFIL